MCNPRAAYANAIHAVQHRRQGWHEHFKQNILRYYHYHGTIDVEDESKLCKELSEDVDSAHNFTRATDSSGPGGELGVVQYDGSMVPFAFTSKKHHIEVLNSSYARRLSET